jgi:YHS domain-containing protein
MMSLKDPICGMSVTENSFYHLEQEGRLLYFCGSKCKNRFARHMAGYTGATDSTVLPTGTFQIFRKIQLRWWLLLAVGLFSMALAFRQLV